MSSFPDISLDSAIPKSNNTSNLDSVAFNKLMIVHRDSVDHHSGRSSNVMMKSRIISGIIACCYLLAALIAKGPLMTFRMAGFLILPLACIWFSHEMGGFTGAGFGRGSITEKSPGWAVAFVGWLLLLLPVFVVSVL